VLEFGTLGGYSTIWLGRGLPADGRLVTLEADPRHAEVARANLARAGLADIAEIRVGPALETLPKLAAEGTGPFDLIFIDADKVNYINYYQRALELLSPNGLILIDNVLWSGDVLLQPAPDASTATIQELNRLVVSDPRVTAVLVTIRDGVLVIKRKM
jgi:caffeoyl-CoA O-methyltransferase